ncbi:ACT domain-containing protein [Thermanaeromonas sp. C210]|uniref:ACT domain-containing protein n=1 Tax=Thermanaeromonas sp. C210 TaxID=2731925 RepID=UPI0020B82EF7|nr:ACT domain-containing protein [Thermanaeromonas sp. C210]
MSDTLAICRLDKDAPLPEWVQRSSFFSCTRTPSELSIVCPQKDVPPNILCEKGWRCFKVEGPLDFSLTGVLASLVTPLAEERISIFAISTYDTDYLLVKEEQLDLAIRVLKQSGHHIE